MKEPPLPPKIWVDSYEFLLEIRPSSDPIFEPRPDEIASGITHFDLPGRGVFISSDTDIRQRLEVLLHEITHAICDAHGINERGRYQEDYLALKFGKAWSALMVDNPKLRRWINWAADRIRREQNRG